MKDGPITGDVQKESHLQCRDTCLDAMLQHSSMGRSLRERGCPRGSGSESAPETSHGSLFWVPWHPKLTSSSALPTMLTSMFLFIVSWCEHLAFFLGYSEPRDQLNLFY